MTSHAEKVYFATFEKRYPSRVRARTALRRSLLARMAGVPTPAALEGRFENSLLFDRIDADLKPSLSDMIETVQRLGRMTTDGLSRFDPFLRIRPRLAAAPGHIRQLAEDLIDQDERISWPASTVIHGDFHPGQCLQDKTGKVWLVDLDDLALGPPEADQGNLAAWIATSIEGSLRDQTLGALKQVLAVETASDPKLVQHFCQIALVRRALKLAGKGQPWALTQLSSST